MGGETDDLREILDGMLEGFQIVGPDWRYVYVNEAAARHGRTERGALVGRTMMECYPGIERTDMFALMERALTDGSSHVLENAFTFADGSCGYFELRIAPVPRGVCVLSIDVTARKNAEAQRERAEERLRRAQHMEALGHLAAGVAHDFNNLLAIMLTTGELALRRTGQPTRRDVETMLEAAEASVGLTRQLLAYARRTVLERSTVDVRVALRELERLMRASAGSRVDVVVEPSAGPELPVDVDRAQLDQIVLNLVSNARDAIESDGRITISISSEVVDEAAAAAHPVAAPGRFTVLRVTDTGEGIDPPTLSRIFEPYFTTKTRERGTGLGLATVHGVVRQHGGHIRVESVLGRGTTFAVYLPVAGPRPVTEPLARAAPVADRAPTVLLADDEPTVLCAFAKILANAGYRVHSAADGAEALALFDAHGPSVGLLVTDLEMPGVHGLDVIAHVRASRPGIPVICTSAHAVAQEERDTQILANVVILPKPFSTSAFLARVAELLPRS